MKDCLGRQETQQGPDADINDAYTCRTCIVYIYYYQAAAAASWLADRHAPDVSQIGTVNSCINGCRGSNTAVGIYRRPWQ